MLRVKISSVLDPVPHLHEHGTTPYGLGYGPSLKAHGRISQYQRRKTDHQSSLSEILCSAKQRLMPQQEASNYCNLFSFDQGHKLQEKAKKLFTLLATCSRPTKHAASSLNRSVLTCHQSMAISAPQILILSAKTQLKHSLSTA